MVLALQAGLVSQELLDALTAVDDNLCSACLFAEYSQRAEPEVRFTSQFLVLKFLASLLRLPRSPLQEGMGIKGVTLPLHLTDRVNLLLNLPMGHCYLKLHASKKNTNRYWKSRSISQRRWATYLDSFRSSTLPHCFRSGKFLAFAKSSLQPRHQLVRFVHITCRSSGFCCGVPTENFHRKATNIDIADFMEKLADLGSSVPKSTASSLAWWVKFLDVPTSFSLTAIHAKKV